MAARRTLYRLHVWLGWVVALPLLLWTVTGLWMAARPIEEVRGEHLRRAPSPIELAGPVSPPGGSLRALAVETGPTGPVWAATFADGRMRRADLRTGALLPSVEKAEAVAIARAAYRGKTAVEQVIRTEAAKPPLELRRPRPAWCVIFADGGHVYIDADTGAVLALRTGQWRLYDMMWGLHILDPRTREETSHALLILAAVISIAGTATGAVLLFLRRRKRTLAGT